VQGFGPWDAHVYHLSTRRDPISHATPKPHCMQVDKLLQEVVSKHKRVDAVASLIGNVTMNPAGDGEGGGGQGTGVVQVARGRAYPYGTQVPGMGCTEGRWGPTHWQSQVPLAWTCETSHALKVGSQGPLAYRPDSRDALKGAVPQLTH
jgi:hypothetical protein